MKLNYLYISVLTIYLFACNIAYGQTNLNFYQKFQYGSTLSGFVYNDTLYNYSFTQDANSNRINFHAIALSDINKPGTHKVNSYNDLHNEYGNDWGLTNGTFIDHSLYSSSHLPNFNIIKYDFLSNKLEKYTKIISDNFDKHLAYPTVAQSIFAAKEYNISAYSSPNSYQQIVLKMAKSGEIIDGIEFQLGDNLTSFRSGTMLNNKILLSYNEPQSDTSYNNILLVLDSHLNLLQAKTIQNFRSIQMDTFLNGKLMLTGAIGSGDQRTIMLDGNLNYIKDLVKNPSFGNMGGNSIFNPDGNFFQLIDSENNYFKEYRNSAGYTVLIKLDKDDNILWQKVIPEYLYFWKDNKGGGIICTKNDRIFANEFNIIIIDKDGHSTPELIDYCGVAIIESNYYKDKLVPYTDIRKLSNISWSETKEELTLLNDVLKTEKIDLDYPIPKPFFLDKHQWCTNSCDTIVTLDQGVTDSSYYLIDGEVSTGIWCPKNEGQYQINHIISFYGGCKDTISAFTNVESTPTLMLQDSAIICDSLKGVLVIADGSPGSKILWNNQYTDGATSKVFYTTGYEIVSAQYNHCTTTDSVYINTIEALVDGWPNFLPDEVGVFCDGEEAIVGIENVNNAVYYTWSDGSHESRISVHQSQNLTVSGELYGCMARDSVRVTFKDCRTAQIFVPNVFSPNHDGVNDELEVFGLNIEIKSFKIFNRWGSERFSGQDSNLKWDGTYRGQDMPSDTYVYFVVYKDLITNTERVEKGGCLAK